MPSELRAASLTLPLGLGQIAMLCVINPPDVGRGVLNNTILVVVRQCCQLTVMTTRQNFT